MATAGVDAAKAEENAERDTLQRQRSVEQAFDEGHDADIPSDIGYILDEAGEEKRRQSLAERRRNSLARKRSRADDEKSHHDHHRDLEQGSGSSNGAPEAKNEDEGGTTSEDEANIVWWDGPDDPHNPYNWTTWRKVLNCVIISALTFVTPLASSIFAPGVPQLMREFKSGNTELAAFVVSVYVLGFAAGPMVIAPFSEIWGRMPIYHACNIAFVGFLVGCALAPSLEALIVFRFFSGVFGSCMHPSLHISLSTRSLTDIRSPNQRRRHNSRHDRAREARSGYGGLQRRPSAGANNRPRGRRIFGRSEGLALGILASRHLVWSIECCPASLCPRDIRTRSVAEEGRSPAEGDRK